MISPCASWAPPCLWACVGAAVGCPRTAPLWPKLNAVLFLPVVVIIFFWHPQVVSYGILLGAMAR